MGLGAAADGAEGGWIVCQGLEEGGGHLEEVQGQLQATEVAVAGEAGGSCWGCNATAAAAAPAAAASTVDRAAGAVEECGLGAFAVGYAGAAGSVRCVGGGGGVWVAVC